LAAVLATPTDRERSLAQAIRELVVRHVNDRGIDNVAHDLGMYRSGVESLLWAKDWSLQEAFRVAEALDLPAIHDLEGAVQQPGDEIPV
jgi:hypothetical protein